MKRLIPHIFASILLLTIFVTPHIASAQLGNFIKCGGSDPGAHACGYNDLIILVQDVISGLVKISTILVAGVLVFAGFKLLTSQGKEGALTDAKEMLWKVLWGYVWVLVAWTLVYTITHTLLNPDFVLLK